MSWRNHARLLAFTPFLAAGCAEHALVSGINVASTSDTVPLVNRDSAPSTLVNWPRPTGNKPVAPTIFLS